MAFAKINGVDVNSARITMPLNGAWIVRATLNTRSTLASTAIFSCDGATLVGSFDRVPEKYAEVTYATILAGTGTISKIVSASGFRALTWRAIAQKIASSASALNTISLLSQGLDSVVPWWAHPRTTLGVALTLIGKKIEKNWSIDDLGAIWFGDRILAPALNPYRVILRDPILKRITIAPNSVFARPGMYIEGEKILFVEHTITASAIRSDLHY